MVWIVVVSALVAIGRFLVPGHDLSPAGSYEAFAHIWVGVLGTLAFRWDLRRGSPQVPAILSLLALTTLEVAMFAIRE